MADHSKLLPDYATDHERRVASVGFDEDALGAAIDRLRTTTNPNTCHGDELPFLAWEESVDVWDDDWSEEIRRRAVDAAEQIHLMKGPPQAIADALAVYGYSARFVEWWQTDPVGEPGTFHATVFVDGGLYPDGPGPLLDARVVAVAEAAIRRTKPLTRHYTFDLGLSLSGLAVFGVAACAGADITIPPKPWTDALIEAPLRIGSAALSAVTLTLPPKVVSALSAAGDVFWSVVGAPTVNTVTLYPRGYNG